MFRKNYKRGSRLEDMHLVSKKGQVTIFVILAIAIVAVIAIIFFVSRNGKLSGNGVTPDPQQYLTSCLEPFVKSSAAALSRQGGYREPTGFIVYNDTKLPYLCYTSDYYVPCIVQQSNILGQFSHELEQSLLPEAQTCVQSFKEDYESQGYSIQTSTVRVNVSFAPHRLGVQVIAPLTITKEVSKTYTHFDLTFDSSLYDLLSLAENIIAFESTYGDSETTLYLRYYPNIRIDKVRLSEGSKVYTVSDVLTHERFTFASRSLAWPPGYAA